MKTKKLHCFVINGPGGHGKDEFINGCIKYGDELGIKVFNFSSIDPCREAAKVFGYDASDKTNRGRNLLVDLKRAWLRYDKNGPNDYLLNCIKYIDEGIVFFHIRESLGIGSLIETARTSGVMVNTLHIFRPGQVVPDTPVDLNTRDYSYDQYIDNDGTLEELYEKAKRFVDNVLK